MVKADDVLLFVQVVENGSFSKVAEVLQLTNSVVSKRIGRLEESLNVQLLYRTTRKLSLTDAGRLLYNKAIVAKKAMQEATNIVSGYSEKVRGTIRMTMPNASANLVLAKALAEFCHLYPEINVEMNVDNRIIDIIDEGYDLAIRTAYLEDSGLVARRLVDSHWFICATPAYLRENGRPQHPRELKEHQCLKYKGANAGSDNWMFTINGQAQNIHVSGQFNTNDLNSLCDAALSNLGIALLPQSLVYKHVKSGKLTSILTQYASKAKGIYAVYPKSKQPDQKLKLLIEHFRKAFLAQQKHFNHDFSPYQQKHLAEQKAVITKSLKSKHTNVY